MLNIYGWDVYFYQLPNQEINCYVVINGKPLQGVSVGEKGRPITNYIRWSKLKPDEIPERLAHQIDAAQIPQQFLDEVKTALREILADVVFHAIKHCEFYGKHSKEIIRNLRAAADAFFCETQRELRDKNDLIADLYDQINRLKAVG